MTRWFCIETNNKHPSNWKKGESSMNENYDLGRNEEEREKTFKLYNSIKTTQAKCQWGAKDCETCEDKDCKMRTYLLGRA